MNILVTGAGGGIGQGVIKSLKMIKDIDIRIVATDINELSAGLYAADKSYLIERHNSDYYLENLKNIFKKEKIDFYIPGTDLELEFCARNKQIFKSEFNVHTIISSLEVIEISNDKYKTALFLKKHNFNYPKTSYLKDLNIKSAKFPFIIKPSVGCNSIGVYKINNLKELRPHLGDTKDVILQEYIGNDETEYTCTVVKIGNQISPVLVFKRKLRFGDTYKAEPIKSKKIEQYIFDVASKLEIDGGCNFQLRIDKYGKPKIFEINSRFSGTTPFCSQLGFNPVEFYIKKSLGLKNVINIDYNSTVIRYWSELVVKKSLLKKFSNNQKIKPVLNKQLNLFS